MRKKPRYADADEEYRRRFRREELDEPKKENYSPSRKYLPNRSFMILASAGLLIAGYCGYKFLDFMRNYKENINVQMQDRPEKVDSTNSKKNLEAIFKT